MAQNRAATLFERDLFGALPHRNGGSGESVEDLFDDIGIQRSARAAARPPTAMRARRASTPVELPLPIPSELRETVAPVPAPARAPTPTPAPAPAPPFPTNCTTISTFRRVPLETERRNSITAATPTSPPVFSITTTALPRIADFDARLPSVVQRVSATEVLIVNRGRALIDTGHLRVDPADATRFQVRVRGQLCHPARVSDRNKLPEGANRFPVAIIIHGQHPAIEFTLTDTGGPRTIAPGSSPPVTLIPARASVRFEIPNHLGYTNLQEHLARNGIVSVSVDTNAANALGSLKAFRAELVLAMLDHLRVLDGDPASALHRRLDFTRVGVVGHSRGGDGVAEMAARNARRPVARRVGLRAVVQIAPTDVSGMTATPLRMGRSVTDGFLVVYGSHDGDVSGAFDPAELSQGWGFFGTGFRHYDRSGTRRAMLFIHGATHNRFNAVWIDPARHRVGTDAHALALKQADNDIDADSVDPALPAATTDPPPAGQRDRRVLSAANHRTLMREFIGGFLFMQLQGNNAGLGLFNGTAANSLGTPVSIQWKHGRQVRTIDFFDDADPRRSDLGGATTTPSFVTERLIELSQLLNIPHHDRLLRAGPPGGPVLVYTSAIPVGKRDFSGFTHLTFRSSKVFPNVSTPAAIAAVSFPPILELALFDGTRRTAVSGTAIATLNPRLLRPYHRTIGTDNLTKVELQTYVIPLSRFTSGSTAVNLTDVRAVEVTFNATAGEEIHLDTLALVTI